MNRSTTIKSGRRDTKAARAAGMEKSAVRALEDPKELARAARIVRAALARKRLAMADLDGDIVQLRDLDPSGGRATDES